MRPVRAQHEGCMSSSERCGPSIRYVHERSCGKKGAQLRDAEHDSLVIMMLA